uniref:THAP-type domain-containing protein n=1 Tax=Sphaeramia orbicularis TaxID=375764 RepID=A0A672YW44_9TELE
SPPRKYVFVGCNTEHKSLHRPPACEPFRRAWLNFIFRGNIPKTVGKSLLVCANHFEDECFSNLGQYREGFALKLHLIEGSVPTAIEQPLFAHKGCQTESKRTCSVGTQLSIKTLQPHVRSAEVSKVPRTKLLCRYKCTCVLGGSVCFVTTEQSTVPIHRTPTYIIYEKCLLELFEVCTVCQRVSVVQTRRLGMFIFWAMRLKMFLYDTCRRHARTCIEPALIHKWKSTQDAMMEKLQEEQNVILGETILQYVYFFCLFLRLSKKMVKTAQNKDCTILKKWLHSKKKKKNHIYWTAASSTTPQERVAKWIAILNHVQDLHTHEDPAFPQCLHPRCISRDKSNWLKPGDSFYLYHLIWNLFILRQWKRSSVILRFAPKRSIYPFLGMLCSIFYNSYLTLH